ncbi:class I SAM-dependent methyltransferase [Carnobacteriaceae bacterium zg-C25]|nr:class I SAM-dependent methyltransferase [Carnobacteriaceae bacterium zg-C25]
MGEHYYSNTPLTQSHEQLHDVHVANMTLKLWTDHGVFSKTGLDFGSRTLIETVIDEITVSGDILDVGCGYGPMGISLAKAFKQRVTMVDINERAVDLANKNAQVNLANAHALVSNQYDNVSQSDFALVVSNPPIRAGKDVVHGIISNSINHLEENGQLVIVIQKKQGAPSAQKKMEEIFGNVTLLNREKGYWILSSTKMVSDGKI